MSILLCISLYVLFFILFDVGVNAVNPKPGKLLKTNTKDNIVAHIYNDRTSYRQHVLSLNRLIFFPLYLIGIMLDNVTPHLCMEKMIVNFSGCITERDGKFTTTLYEKDKTSYRIWKNISGIHFFPSYKKMADYTCWTTAEGDCVEYIPISKIEKETNKILTLYQFLKFTKQTYKEFKCNESIKYSGC